MGARRVSPEEIVEMFRLYAIYGTYKAVADVMGRSPSTVAKYIQMQNVPNNVRIAVNNLIYKEER